VSVNLMTVQVESNGESAIRLKSVGHQSERLRVGGVAKKIKDLMFLFYHV
jgi:hypothetical protein